MNFLKILKKKQIVIYVVALMLVTAGYLNYTSGEKFVQTSSDPEVTYKENIADIGDAALVSSNEVKEDEETKEVSATEEYFSKSKLERDTMYSQMLETYQNIINSNTVTEDQKNLAVQEITNINNTENAIMVCENLLTTKGFENNVVFVNGNNVTVVVKVEGELATNQVAQIQNIISREIKVEVENITITEKQ